MDYKTLDKVEHVTFTPNKVPLGQKTIVTVTVDKGFMIDYLKLINSVNFKAQTYGTYKDGKLTIDFTNVPDNLAKSSYFDYSVVDDPKIKFKATIPAVKHVTFIPNKIPVGTITTVRAIPDPGYKINKIYFYIEDPYTGVDMLEANYDNGTITFDLTNFTNDDVSTIENAEKIVDVKKYTPIYYTLPTAAHVTFSPTQVPLGTITKITLTPEQNYVFNNGKGLVLDNGSVLGGFQGKNTYNIDLTKYSSLDQLKTAKWDLNFTKNIQQIPIKLNLTNCTSDTISIPENTNKTITLKANTGYYFDDDIIIYSYGSDITNPTGYSKVLVKANVKDTITINLKVGSYDNYQYALKSGLDLPSITAKATKPDAIPNGLESLNIYDMSDGEIDSFMNSLVETWGTEDIESVNFTEYVNQIYRIPFDVPIKDTTNITSIRVGKYFVPVNTKKVNKDKLIINCGTIEVKPHYNNSNDYNPLECKLYLPFTKEIELNINDIINHKISIIYNVDLLNGETTAIISNENYEIYTEQFNVSTSLEYYGLYTDTITGNLNSVYINDILQAYIKLIYNKPIDNLVSYETYEHGTLKNYKGLTKCVNTQLHLDATFQEKQEILTQLQQGVIIK